MRILTVIGARPQFIKAAALSRILRKEHNEIFIHTGQHYDTNMSAIFFQELSIPHPDYNLGVSGGSHGEMTGRMLIELDKVLLVERPDLVLVYGDTNSTLAGALSAIKLHIPVCHIEAGVRTGAFHNPEEVNRILTDRISSQLYCCTETAIDNLKREGITDGVYNTGDLMYDSLLFYGKQDYIPRASDIIDFNNSPVVCPPRYYYLTCHRQENTVSDEPLRQIFLAIEELDAPAIYPVHPRSHERALRLHKQMKIKNSILIRPVGYLASLYLVRNAIRVITDSGGLQREAWFYNTPCVTLHEHTAWPETLAGFSNQLCSVNKGEILQKLTVPVSFTQNKGAFGDGRAAEKITTLLSGFKER